MADSGPSSGTGPPADPDSGVLKLPELLELGWKIFEEVDHTNEPMNSISVQDRVRRGVSALEEAAAMVAQLELFSRNEELEEVATADLRFLLLPALLGALRLKLSDRAGRLQHLHSARELFLDFLRRCKDYGLCKSDLPEPEAGSPESETEPGHAAQSGPVGQPSLAAMATRRQDKIEQYRQKKELEARLSELQRAVEGGQADDEVTREFHLLRVRRWVAVCLEELQSIDLEMQVLQSQEFMKQGSSKPPSHRGRQPMKPFILTRDAAQAQVFGAGYPSLPTMTVNDWYEQHAKHGQLPDQGIPRRQTPEDSEDNEEEEKEDEQSLQKAREWDDWKDNHRRGYGNRHNMG
ncbi:Immunoglobulin-binding protein 1 [Oryzias melastigma]|uniref:Immunoglobulin (CD79A) binding protein 1 n=1 Tax=Oryzias melastigma TaxID=30732 RepID=A0A3B3BW77_ORYME|nr:immunoglobulin-binding protein 1 [Oryzias melastigma]KAF6737380.1 Immunoglobulin-binding protein 1 [Oryzias melastigma]